MFLGDTQKFSGKLTPLERSQRTKPENLTDTQFHSPAVSKVWKKTNFNVRVWGFFLMSPFPFVEKLSEIKH